MQSRRSPGYIRFFYLFILLGLGTLITDAVSDALMPEKAPLAWRPSSAKPASVAFAELDFYIPPEWRKPSTRVPSAATNPFRACKDVSAKQAPVTDASRFAMLTDVRDQLSSASDEQVRLLEGMRACAERLGACSGDVRKETGRLKQQIEKNVSRLRIYMALMDNRADAYRARIWSQKDAGGHFLFTLKDVAAATSPDAPFRNIVLKHLVGSFAEKGELQGLSDKEVQAAVDIYNKDVTALMKNFRPEAKGRFDENQARVAFFKKQIDEIKKFYQSKYSVLIGRGPILAYYRANTYADNELAAAIGNIESNAKDFHAKNLPANARGWLELGHLIMNGPAVEAHLKNKPENCAVAQSLHQSAQSGEKFKSFFTRWRGWFVFGGVTACVLASGGTLALPCGAGGALVSSAFLASDYIILDADAAELIINTKQADPGKILEVWARAKKFKVNVVLHVISLATLVGVIPIATTDPLRNAVQELLKNSTEPIAAQILIERLVVKFQGVIEAKVIESLVNSWTSVEKDLASDKDDLQYYHQFVKKLRKS